MPHLRELSLSLVRVDEREVAALAALTGLTRLDLVGEAAGGVAAPVPLPEPMELLRLV
jgi:hypothetical protein